MESRCFAALALEVDSHALGTAARRLTRPESTGWRLPAKDATAAIGIGVFPLSRDHLCHSWPGRLPLDAPSLIVETLRRGEFLLAPEAGFLDR
jgi:hypothetical protein